MNLGDYWTKHHPSSHHKNFRSLVLTPMKYLMEFRSKHIVSTERVQAQKKTQLTNMNRLKTTKIMLEQTTVGASAEYQPHSNGVLDWGIGLSPRMVNNACKIPKICGAVGKITMTSYVRYSSQYVCQTD